MLAWHDALGGDTARPGFSGEKRDLTIALVRICSGNRNPGGIGMVPRDLIAIAGFFRRTSAMVRSRFSPLNPGASSVTTKGVVAMPSITTTATTSASNPATAPATRPASSSFPSPSKRA